MKTLWYENLYSDNFKKKNFSQNYDISSYILSVHFPLTITTLRVIVHIY